MKKIFTLAILTTLAMGMVNSVSAQKLAFVNSSLILKEMPEVKVAESELNTFKSQLEKRFEQKVTALQTKYQELQRKESQGDMSPKQLQDEGTKLGEEEKKLREEQQSLEQQIMTKQNELLAPILERVNDAINVYSKEKGYDMVFDASPGIVYVNEAIDITSVIKGKLGL